MPVRLADYDLLSHAICFGFFFPLIMRENNDYGLGSPDISFAFYKSYSPLIYQFSSFSLLQPHAEKTAYIGFLSLFVFYF